MFRSTRLYARQFEEGDAPAAFAMWADPAVTRFTGDESPADLAVIAQDIPRWRAVSGHGVGCGFWAVLVETGEAGAETFVGDVFVRPFRDRVDEYEIGWHLAAAHWRKGYATEIAKAAISYAHAHRLPRLVALIDPANTASLRVAEKAGMRFEGLSDRYDPEDGEVAVYIGEGPAVGH